MDDKLLEKRLKSLKHSYDEMPIQNNKGKILDAVKTIEKPRRKIFHFPYVASLSGLEL